MMKPDINSRILILDGAMGTMLQRCGASYDVADRLNLTDPEKVAQVHRLYIGAGADIIETNTFNNVSPECNLEGAAIARRCADEASRIGRKVWVAGSMGPGSQLLGIASDYDHMEKRPTSFDAVAEGYRLQAGALVDGGADLIIVETVFDPVIAKAALWAIWEAFEEKGRELPVMVSASVGNSAGRLLTGQSIEAFLYALSSYPLFSFGMNCSFGAEGLLPIFESIAPEVPFATSIHPNAGLPDGLGGFSGTPGSMAELLAGCARRGNINIAGGCCGTTPGHIKAISKALKGIAPRVLPHPSDDGRTILSGLDTAQTGKGLAPLRCGRCAEDDGEPVIPECDVILLNTDGEADSAKEMESLVRRIESDPFAASRPLLLESKDMDTIVAGLKNAQGRSAVRFLTEDTLLRSHAAETVRRLGGILLEAENSGRFVF